MLFPSINVVASKLHKYKQLIIQQRPDLLLYVFWSAVFNACFVNGLFKKEEHLLSDSKMLRCLKWQKICKQGYNKQILIHKLGYNSAKTHLDMHATLWKYLWITGTSKNTNTWLWLEGTSFDGHGFGVLLFQGKEIDRPKTTQKKTLRFWYWLAIFWGGPNFYGFFPVLERNATAFSASPYFLPGLPNPATLWKLKQVRCGVRFCLGGVMSVWYRSTLLECFKWFAWWKTDGGFWMAYPFWQYYKARVELALPISSSETGPAGTTAFDAL